MRRTLHAWVAAATFTTRLLAEDPGAKVLHTCRVSASEPCDPVTFQPDVNTLVYPGGETRCMNEAFPDYAFNVIRRDPNKLLVYFEGGYICFNRFSETMHTCTRKIEDDPLIVDHGVFSSSPANAFRSHTVVYVNYCSGDLYVGNNGNQIGVTNTRSAVTWIQKNLPHISSLVLMGESAGAVGIQFWARNLLDGIKHDHATVVVDSLVTAAIPQVVQNLLSAQFGICHNGMLSRAEDRARCLAGELTVENLFIDVIDDHPDVLFAVINSKRDLAQIWVYNFMSPFFHMAPMFLAPARYLRIVNAYLMRLDQRPNVVSYIVDANTHCFTSMKWLPTTDTTGPQGKGAKGQLLLQTWLSQLLSRTASSQCHGTPLPIAQWHIRDTHYCSESQVRKTFGAITVFPQALPLVQKQLPRAGPRKSFQPRGARPQKSCTMGWMQKCELQSMSTGEITAVYPGGSTRCISTDSSAYSFDVIPGDSDKLLLYFEGGGICANEFSSLLHTCATSADEAPLEPEAGVFSRNATNAFSRHTVVFLNYCSGDLFVGNSATPAGNQFGLANAQAAVDWAKANVGPKLKSFVVIGESAGAAGVHMWAHTLLNTFRSEHSVVIIDSLIAGICPPAMQAELVKTFNLCDVYLLGDADKQVCREGFPFDINNVFSSVMEQHPEVLFAVINSKADAAQISMYDFMAPLVHASPGLLDPVHYFHLVNKYLARFSQRPNFVSYLINSPLHGWTSKEWMATTDTTGEHGSGLSGAMTLSAWLSSCISPRPQPLQSQCSGTVMTPIDAEEELTLDHCDAKQVSKVAGQVGPPMAKRASGMMGGFEMQNGQSGQFLQLVVTILLCLLALVVCTVANMVLCRLCERKDCMPINSDSEDEEETGCSE